MNITLSVVGKSSRVRVFQLFLLVSLSFLSSQHSRAQTWQVRHHAYGQNALKIVDAGPHVWTHSSLGYTRYEKATGASQTWGVLEGMPSRYPEILVVDSSMNLWASYPDQLLIRFNGVKIDTIDYNKGRLSYPDINAITVNPTGGVYFIGVFVSKIPGEREAFIARPNDDSTWELYTKMPPPSSLNSLAVTRDGTVWTAGTFGWGDAMLVLRLDSNGITTFSSQDGLPEKWNGGRYTITISPDQQIWVHNRKGVSRFYYASWISYQSTIEEDLDLQIESLSFGPSGVWIMGNGIAYFQANHWTSISSTPPFTIVILGVIEADEKLFAVTDLGIYERNGNSWTKVDVSSFGVSGPPTRIVHGIKQNSWVGFIDGVVEWGGTSPRTYTTEKSTPGLFDVKLNDIAIVRGGFWKIFQKPLGVGYFNGQTWTLYGRDQLVNESINALAVDRDGVLWTAGKGGLNSFDGNSWKRFAISDSLARVRDYRSIAIDSTGKIWTISLSHSNGAQIHSFDGTTWSNFSIPSPRTDMVIGLSCLCVDKDNIVYVAGPPVYDSFYNRTGGLYRIDGDQMTTFDIHKIFRYLDILDLHCSRTDRLFVSASGGLLEWVKDTLFSRTAIAGIGAEEVQDIAESPLGELMIATSIRLLWLDDWKEVRTLHHHNGMLGVGAVSVASTPDRLVVSNYYGIHEEFLERQSVSKYVRSEDSLEVYPNPASQVLTIEIPESMGPQAMVMLSSMTGEILKNVHAENGSVQIDVSDLVAQVVYITVSDGLHQSRGKAIKL
jgi:hypothetical protein